VVGLVVPQRLDDVEGTINHIGVVPEFRGMGYVDDLLAKGTALLQGEGFKTVVAETDEANAPMRAALERGGFRRTGAIWLYVTDLRAT
jgi:ribosomal protein S18 acetylase RimI-like enzyme